MRISITLAAMLVLGSTSAANAGGQEGSIGVGAEFGLIGALSDVGGLGGASVNYDAGKFHVGGALGFADADGPDNTVYSIAGRFYYHVHSTAMSDFGIGGNIGILSVPAAPNDRNTLLFLEPGVQIRAFVASNVALSFNVGFVLGAVDASGTFIGGQTTGSAGIHYYFF
jgi:hypothetical protein